MHHDAGASATARAAELSELVAALVPAIGALVTALDELSQNDRAHIARVYDRLARTGALTP